MSRWPYGGCGGWEGSEESLMLSPRGTPHAQQPAAQGLYDSQQSPSIPFPDKSLKAASVLMPSQTCLDMSISGANKQRHRYPRQNSI